MSDECCEKCRFFLPRVRKDGTAEAWGDCRRYPPQWHGDGEMSSPVMDPDEWCGEFKRKDAASE